MEFDIIELTGEELEKLSTIQTQLLRTAQKNKNEMRYKLEQDMQLFEKLILTNDTYHSSLIADKRAELEKDFDYKVAVLKEQLEYAMELNEPYPDRGDVDEETGYIVDYTLSYTDRYVRVREYYLSVEDAAARMALYSADEVAKKYLGSYYSTLYNVLSTYSQ